MSYVTPIDPPLDYPERVKSVRDLKGLTQAQLAELIGVSFASVNRWENGQSRPNSLSWRRILARYPQKVCKQSGGVPSV